MSTLVRTPIGPPAVPDLPAIPDGEEYLQPTSHPSSGRMHYLHDSGTIIVLQFTKYK